MSIDEIREDRLKKLELLKGQGIDPYPAECNRTHNNEAFLDAFAELETSGASVTLAGRVMSVRDQGGIMFVDVFDGTKRVQWLFKRDHMDESAFQLFLTAMNPSDFVEATGTAFMTRVKKPSLMVDTWRVLAKSLRQVPDEWFGLKDEDERYRKRYIDMILHEDVAKRMKQRSVFWNAIRSFLLERGFVEVETPVLETTTGGAEARPFITHHNALDIEVYLRISLELWQKRLMVGGLPKTFEIGRIFRNEGISPEHAQDYTQLEFYVAYEDARRGVPMVIDLYRHAAQATFGTLQFTINGFDVDLGAVWKDLDFNELMKERYGFDPREVTREEVKRHLDKEHIAYEPTADVGRGVDLLWKQIRKTIGGPAILTGMPVYLEPLAKKSQKDLRTVDRYQLLIGGSELGKGFNELNDPIDQTERFVAQQALRDAGDEEAQMADMEYVEAMEYGMPPTFGFGVSERLFSFLAGITIREAQLFPLMRPKGEE